MTCFIVWLITCDLQSTALREGIWLETRQPLYNGSNNIIKNHYTMVLYNISSDITKKDMQR